MPHAIQPGRGHDRWRDPRAEAIERLMDNGDYRTAARLACQAREAASSTVERRRFHGLLRFANSRLPKHEQIC